MNIIKSTSGLSKMDQYKMIKDAGIQSISSLEDKTVLTFEAYILYSDIDKEGEEIQLLSIKTAEGVYATNSKTFIEDFTDALDILDESDITTVTVLKGQSKANRTYYRCSIS